jgi:acetylornithine deacetylase/succinyl-diaminopimelate desuccinylase-like protein
MCERVRPDVVRLVRQLVEVQSYSFEEEAVACRVQDALDWLGYDLAFRDAVGNVIGIMAGSTPGPVLLLKSHMDTPRPGDSSGGDVLPQGTIRHDRLYGIGTADGKGALAIQLYGGYVLQRIAPFFRGILVVVATVAELDGCGVGTDHLLRHTLPELDLEPTLMVRGEPTDLDLRHRGDGRADLLATIAGADEDAVVRAADRIYRRLSTTRSSAGEHRLGASRVVRPAYARNEDGRLEASLRVTCRIPPRKTADSCLHWVQRVAGLADEDLSLKASVLRERRSLFTGAVTDVVHSVEPWSTDPGDPVVRCVHEALRASGWARGNLPRPSFRTNTALPGRPLQPYNVPTLGFGPGDERLASVPQESVSINDIGKGIFGTAVLVNSILAPRRRFATAARVGA